MQSQPQVPYIPSFANLQLESVIGFVLGALFAVLFLAEGQAYMATTLGDRRPGAKDRFHYNAFLHLDPLGAVAFVLGGFGWARPLDIDPSRFPHPRLYLLLSRLSGPIANLLAAGIGASLIHLIMSLMALDPHIFLGVVAVNITVAVYNFLPLPPLALGTALVEMLPDSQAALKTRILRMGPYLVVALAAYDRFSGAGWGAKYLHPLIVAIYNFTTR